MDQTLRKIELLAELARQETWAKFPPINPEVILERIRHLKIAPAKQDGFSYKMFTGLGVAAAMAAAIVLVFSISAWMDINNPLLAIDSLMDVMS